MPQIIPLPTSTSTTLARIVFVLSTAILYAAFVSPAYAWLAAFVVVFMGALNFFALTLMVIGFSAHTKALAATPPGRTAVAWRLVLSLTWLAQATLLAYGGHPWVATAWLVVLLLLLAAKAQARAQAEAAHAKSCPADQHPV